MGAQEVHHRDQVMGPEEIQLSVVVVVGQRPERLWPQRHTWVEFPRQCWIKYCRIKNRRIKYRRVRCRRHRLVDPAHPIDGDFLDQKLLFDHAVQRHIGTDRRVQLLFFHHCFYYWSLIHAFNLPRGAPTRELKK